MASSFKNFDKINDLVFKDNIYPIKLLPHGGSEYTNPHNINLQSRPVPTHEFWTPLIWNFHPTSNQIVVNPFVIAFSESTTENMQNLAGIPLNSQQNLANLTNKFNLSFKSDSFPNPFAAHIDDDEKFLQPNAYTYNGSRMFSLFFDDFHSNETFSVEDYGHWHVKLKLTTGNKTILMTLAHGVPFIFFELRNISTFSLLPQLNNTRLWYASPGVMAFSDIRQNVANHSALYFHSDSADISSNIYFTDNKLSNILKKIDFTIHDSGQSSSVYLTIALLPDQINDFIQLSTTHVSETKKYWQNGESKSFLVGHNGGTSSYSRMKQLRADFGFSPSLADALGEFFSFNQDQGGGLFLNDQIQYLNNVNQPLIMNSFVPTANKSNFIEMLEILKYYHQFAFSPVTNTTFSYEILNSSTSLDYGYRVKSTFSYALLPHSFVKLPIFHDFSSQDNSITTSNVSLNSQSTLMALYPHQWKNSINKIFNYDSHSFEKINGQRLLHQLIHFDPNLSQLTYQSSRGPMMLLSGSSFQTEVPFIGYIPFLDIPSSNYSASEITKLHEHINNFTKLSDPQPQFIPTTIFQDHSMPTYKSGKLFNKIIQVLPIAKQVSPNFYQALLNQLTEEFFKWKEFKIEEFQTMKDQNGNYKAANDDKDNFLGQDFQFFAYIPSWNTLVGYPSDFSSASMIQDHHFHYGYFIKAAATLWRYQADIPTESYRNQFRDVVDPPPGYDDSTYFNPSVLTFINELIKDVAYTSDAFTDDATNNKYPFLRAFDPYLGYSLANGNGDTFNGNNVESSSESLNFAAAVISWGLAIQNDNIRDLGMILYSIESESVAHYWYDKHDLVFPKNMYGGDYLDFDYAGIGMVWSSKTDFATWFGLSKRFIHGINFLPITTHSFYLNQFQKNLIRIYEESVDPGLINREFFQYYINNGNQDMASKSKTWSDIFYNTIAMVSPNTAMEGFNDLMNSTTQGYYLENQAPASTIYETLKPTGEDGESRLHSYHWISTLQKLGSPDFSTKKSWPFSMAFKQGNQFNYVVYNPGSKVITAKFRHESIHEKSFSVSPNSYFVTGNLFQQSSQPILPESTTSYEQQIQNLNAEISRLNAVVDQKTALISALQSTNENQAQQILVLNQDVLDFQTQISQLEATVETLRNSGSDSSPEQDNNAIKRIYDEILALATENYQLQSDVIALRSTNLENLNKIISSNREISTQLTQQEQVFNDLSTSFNDYSAFSHDQFNQITVSINQLSSLITQSNDASELENLHQEMTLLLDEQRQILELNKQRDEHLDHQATFNIELNLQISNLNNQVENLQADKVNLLNQLSLDQALLSQLSHDHNEAQQAHHQHLIDMMLQQPFGVESCLYGPSPLKNTQKGRFEIKLNRQANIDIMIYTVGGQKIDHIFYDGQNIQLPHIARIYWPRDYRASSLGNGMYYAFVTIQHENKVIRKTITFGVLR